MARTGRPPLWATVDEFVEKCNPYGFEAWCAENDKIPLWEWFAVYCGCSIDAILDYAKKDGVDKVTGEYDAQKDFSEVIKKVGQVIIAAMIQNGLLGKYRDAMTIFYLKNYGYSDKQEIITNKNILIVSKSS